MNRVILHHQSNGNCLDLFPKACCGQMCNYCATTVHHFHLIKMVTCRLNSCKAQLVLSNVNTYQECTEQCCIVPYCVLAASEDQKKNLNNNQIQLNGANVIIFSPHTVISKVCMHVCTVCIYACIVVHSKDNEGVGVV